MTRLNKTVKQWLCGVVLPFAFLSAAPSQPLPGNAPAIYKDSAAIQFFQRTTGWIAADGAAGNKGSVGIAGRRTVA